MSNLKIYEQARNVPDEAKKSIAAGRLKGMTDINPMWRIKKLTELFGPCGVGWWYEITDKHLAVDELTHQVAAFVDIKLYYVDPESGKESRGIPGTGGASFVAQERNGPYMSDECYKMALTDAISVAAKSLGVGADVYWDKDRSKYNQLACEECRTLLMPYIGRDNKEVSVRKHVDGSLEKFGKCLCLTCINKKLAGEGA